MIMAIYHFSGQIISRSAGRSSVSASAYRSASKLEDQRLDRIFDYQKKLDDLLHQEILLPDNAPSWMKNREKLWNAVEISEKRKDSQLAREFNISLPRELTPDQNIELILGFVQKEFVDKEMVADVCVHRGHRHGEDQPHAHVMLTLREVNQDGFGKKVRDWNDKAYLNHWREAWADHCNRKFLELGINQKIDHRTLEAQGIDLEPQRKIGAKSAQSKLARLAEHQTIARENGERLFNNPEIALKAITQHQSTFTHQDIARFVNRHSESVDQFQAVYEKVKSHESVVKIGLDEKGRERFSTREMVNLESNLLETAIQKSKENKFQISIESSQKVLNHYSLFPGQKAAFQHVVSGQDLSCVVGVAGSGKSYLLGAAREAWEKEGYRVQGLTLSGIAAENLEASSEIKSYTVASRLWHWERDCERLTSKDIIVIDEAGMLGSRQLNAILTEAKMAGAKVVLVGDPEQLQAIDAGAAFRAICELVNVIKLMEVTRQAETWQQKATINLSKGETQEALHSYQERGHILAHDTEQTVINEIVKNWRSLKNNHPKKSQIIFAYRRDQVKTLNQAIRENRHQHGELGEDHLLKTERGKKKLAVGETIYFLQTEKFLGVKNGTLGTIEAIFGQELTVKVKNPSGLTRSVSFHLGDYGHIDHGYAATLHKAQGVTVDSAQVLVSQYFDRHAAYVALSRHRDNVTLHYSRDVFVNDQKLVQTLSRVRAKDFTQDYVDKPEKLIQPEQKEMRSIVNFSRLQKLKQQDEMKRQRALEQNKRFRDFKHSYENKHLGKAASIQPELASSKEQRRAIEIEARCVKLEKSMEQSKFAHNEKRIFASYAKELERFPQIMSELKTRNPKLLERVLALGKSYERNLDRDIGR